MVATRRTSATTQARRRGPKAAKTQASVPNTTASETRRIVRRLIKRYRRALSELD